MEKEKIVLALIDLDELIKISKDDKNKQILKAQHTKLNNKLKELEEKGE